MDNQETMKKPKDNQRTDGSVTGSSYHSNFLKLQLEYSWTYKMPPKGLTGICGYQGKNQICALGGGKARIPLNYVPMQYKYKDQLVFSLPLPSKSHYIRRRNSGTEKCL